MNKKELTEADIRTKFITPALIGTNDDKWNVMTQLREEIFFTKGRVIVRGKTVKRSEAKKADYTREHPPQGLDRDPGDMMDLPKNECFDLLISTEKTPIFAFVQSPGHGVPAAKTPNSY